MDANRFDALAVTRAVPRARSRRGVVSGLLLGTLSLLGWPDAPAAAAQPGQPSTDQAQRTRCPNRLKVCHQQLNRCRAQLRPHPCAGKNWCLDRTQTCGPADGSGKCLVMTGGGNVCGEIQFQATSCAGCADICPDCQCVLAAGGGDRCGNGASGSDFICVQAV